MKRSLVALVGAGIITASWFVVANAQGPAGAGGQGGWHRGNPLEHMTESLNLTADQQAKIQPIIDQATPQLRAIHQEAMQKMHTVMDNAMSQIRPLLTPDQQKKADDIRQAHQDVRNAVKKLHDVKSQ
jgi:Spy/CpxP family protein refolding chaperone